MKVICALMLCSLTLSSADDNPRGKLIQVCGSELARAMNRVCVHGDLDYFNLQHLQHNHQHDHNHQQHQHSRDHQNNHQHEHQHEHHHHHEWKHADKELSSNLADECCVKPCHVKDFVSYCPNKVK